MPADVPLPVAATAGFLVQHLGPARRRVLEVGCGDGAVAALLRRAGHAVTAIDADPAMIARARSRGVDARCVRWPDFAADGFDAVAFTRSLHHVPDLAAAVMRAESAVVPHGLLLVEDFAPEAADAVSLQWFRELVQSVDDQGLLRDSELLHRTLSASGDLLAAWREDHGADVHPFEDVEAAVAERFRPTSRAEVPYFYRYLAAAVVDGDEAEAAVRAAHDAEERAARAGEIVYLGRRLVARAPLPA